MMADEQNDDCRIYKCTISLKYRERHPQPFATIYFHFSQYIAISGVPVKLYQFSTYTLTHTHTLRLRRSKKTTLFFLIFSKRLPYGIVTGWTGFAFVLWSCSFLLSSPQWRYVSPPPTSWYTQTLRILCYITHIFILSLLAIADSGQRALVTPHRIIVPTKWATILDLNVNRTVWWHLENLHVHARY